MILRLTFRRYENERAIDYGDFINFCRFVVGERLTGHLLLLHELLQFTETTTQQILVVVSNHMKFQLLVFPSRIISIVHSKLKNRMQAGLVDRVSIFRGEQTRMFSAYDVFFSPFHTITSLKKLFIIQIHPLHLCKLKLANAHL